MSQSKNTTHVFGAIDVLNYTDLNNTRMTGLAPPILGTDAANKNYVDNKVVASNLTGGVGITVNTANNTINSNPSQTHIVALGTIQTGTWSANTVQIPYGGTGQSDVIPNVYGVATVEINENLLTLSLIDKQHDFVENDTVRIYDEKNKYFDLKVINVINSNSFTLENTDGIEMLDGKLFVYGKFVNDFNILDKDAIFTVAVAATQQIDRELQATKQELASLKAFLQSKFPGEI